MRFGLLLLLLFSSGTIAAQTCLTGGLPEYQIDGDAGANSDAVEITFDDMADYLGGKTIYGATNVRVSVTDGDAVANCGWKLTMTLDNNGTANEGGFEVWEEKFKYGSGSIGKPRIDVLNIKVDNNCSTPDDVSFRTLANPGTIGTALEIIDNPAAAPNAAGTCDGTEIDGPGTWLSTDHGQFTFIIDFAIDPGFDYQPGIYELSLNVTLEPR